ncbi:GntR family transcriptional regulator [Anaerococcus sp. NML200574]|uniref:GntR family transcriptional regulator n=1 Tax=Anaerococcus sp. NML200574 TaxID=2954486 RepID=UPI0022375BEB|nr:GntR family transcriptional regulator [Anaerococcus sp. NML200574]MCW6679273.1 GntR family transcriptional regulator [Anaerococcus sp. NML200574]
MKKKLYEIIRDDLLEKIKDSTFEINEMIPKETDLALEYGVSRPTVRQAIQALVDEGYLDRVKGKGTFVKNKKITQDFTNIIKSFNDDMKAKGIIPRTKLISSDLVECPERVANALHQKSKSKVIKICRLRYADSIPAVLVNTYLPYDGLENLIGIDYSSVSLYTCLDQLGYKINKVSRILEMKISDELSASLLNIACGDPLFFFKTIGYHKDLPLEYSEAWYNGNINSFKFEITIN